MFNETEGTGQYHKYKRPEIHFQFERKMYYFETSDVYRKNIYFVKCRLQAL